jgi:hypothetical protein
MPRFRNLARHSGLILPREPVVIRPGHPQLVGLKSAWLAQNFRGNSYVIAANSPTYHDAAPDSGTGYLSGINGTTAPVLLGETEFGPATEHPGYGIFGVPSSFQPFAAGGHSPATIAVVGRIASLSSLNTATLYGFSSASVSGGWPHLLINVTNSGGNYNLIGDVRLISTSPAQLSLSNFAPPGNTVAVILTTRSATDHEILAANLTTGAITSLASLANSGAATTNANSEAIGVMRSSGLLSQALTGAVNGAFYWNRAFTAEEMAEWATAPFGMLAPAQPRQWTQAYARSPFAFTTPLHVTQAGAEFWSANIPPLEVTQAGVEAWYSLVPALVVTKAGQEVWFDQASLIPDVPPPAGSRRRRRFFLVS